MKETLAQMLGIIRYEFRIHWRRRGLKVMFLALLVMQVVFWAGTGLQAVAPKGASWTAVVLFGTSVAVACRGGRVLVAVGSHPAPVAGSGVHSS